MMSVGASLAVLLVGLVVLAAIVIEARQRRCDHRSTVRYWFKGHRWLRVCKLCGRSIARGRDPSHRYPDEAPGVRRGRRRQAS